MGRLYELLQEHMDNVGYAISKRQVAARLEVSPSTLDNWREPKELIDKDLLIAIAHLTGNPYSVVLNAILEDIGYLYENQSQVRSGKSGGKRRQTRTSVAAERLRETDQDRAKRIRAIADNLRALAEFDGRPDRVKEIDRILTEQTSDTVKLASLVAILDRNRAERDDDAEVATSSDRGQRLLEDDQQPADADRGEGLSR